MDIRMDYVKAKGLGAEGLLSLLVSKFPSYDLYSISTGWLESCRYIAKARGTYGDVIVSWE